MTEANSNSHIGNLKIRHWDKNSFAFRHYLSHTAEASISKRLKLFTLQYEGF